MPRVRPGIWDATTGEITARVKAWWYGVDRRDLAPMEPIVPQPVAVGNDPPLDRIAISQQVWGHGFVQPGGPAYALSLIKPFGVNPAMSLLDLAAGLGGPSRTVSESFDVYITGLERVAELARRGHAMSIDAGFGKKVPISAYDPETVELRARGFDGVYAQHLTCSIVDKERLFREVMRSLKARGHFAFVDFVLKDGTQEDPQLNRLRQLEPFALLPWKISQYTDCLTSVGFDCRITEDQTLMYKTLVVEGWDRLLKTVNLKTMPKTHLLALLDEADLWVQRLKAIDSGVLGVTRFYAISSQSAVI